MYSFMLIFTISFCLFPSNLLSLSSRLHKNIALSLPIYTNGVNEPRLFFLREEAQELKLFPGRIFLCQQITYFGKKGEEKLEEKCVP